MLQQLETPNGKVYYIDCIHDRWCGWSCGVMVSTLDFESKDPSSSLGRT